MHHDNHVQQDSQTWMPWWWCLAFRPFDWSGLFNRRQDSSHHHHKTWRCEALDWRTKLKLFVCRHFFDASIAFKKYYRIFPASSLNSCKLFTFHQALLIIITCTVNATASQHCQLILMYENATTVLSPPLLFSFWKGTSQLIQASPRSPLINPFRTEIMLNTGDWGQAWNYPSCSVIMTKFAFSVWSVCVSERVCANVCSYHHVDASLFVFVSRTSWSQFLC